MRRGPQLVELKLTMQEYNQFVEWTRRHKTSQALALRSRIMLACAQEVAETKSRALSSQATDRRQMAQAVPGTAARGLLDEPRPGTPPSSMSANRTIDRDHAQ